MQKGKFLTLLGTLNPEEFSAFDKHLKRTLAKDSAALSLFRYIKQFYPNFKGEIKLELHYAYAKAIKSTSENNTTRKTQLNVLSDLNNMLKEFLLLEELKKTSFESNLLWMRILNKRKLEIDLQRNIGRNREETSDVALQSTIDLLNSIYFNHENFYVFNKKKEANDTTLADCLKNMDLFYVAFGFKVCCELVNRDNLLGESFDKSSIESIKKLAKDKGLEDHPLYRLYHCVYNLLSDWHEQNFSTLEAMLIGQEFKIHQDDLTSVISYLQNYTAHQIRRGKDEYMWMQHRINKFAVTHDYFLKNDLILFDNFVNVVSVAAFCKEFDWVEAFINSHKKLLQLADYEAALQFSAAIIHFEKGKFNDSLNTLSGEDYSQFAYNIRAKALMMRCYYELKDEHLCHECAERFMKSLKRGEKPRMKAIEGTMNFMAIIKSLCHRSKNKEKIMEEIEKCEQLYFKSWLVEKTKKYKKISRSRK